jgi:serine/threonine protein kinase
VIRNGIKLSHPLSFGFGVEVWAAKLGEKNVVVRRYFGSALTASPRVMPDASILYKLDHPRLQKLLWHGTDDDGTLMQISQWVEGKSVRSLMGGTEISSSDIIVMFEDALCALAYLHRGSPVSPVMHADVSPSNMIFGPVAGRNSDGLTLVDIRGAVETSQNRSDLILGTLHYMSDQMLAGEPVTPAAEIWSLAISLMSATAGKTPWAEAKHPEEVLKLRAETTAIQLLDELTRLDDKIKALFRDMLAPNPADRPDACEIIELLGK